ncbi:hypothetical protein PybrP1_007296 [[Pythium] brassicae (nom. inval.)]|nr:hypothetical protein PybrP1_007296 [[Pythium] brassicae (nom. inval.)]
MSSTATPAATAAAVAASASFVALQLSCRGNAARERVLRDFVSFLEARGELAQLQALPRTPKGAAVDWLRLYEEVVARGGCEAVTRHKLWGAIAARDCLALDVMPFTLALYYERFLAAFEAKQLFGRDAPLRAVPAKRRSGDSASASGATSSSCRAAEDDEEDRAGAARVATASELQEAQNMGGTPLPPAPKRLKVQRSGQPSAALGTLHGLVLALDAGGPAESLRALNVLSVLSFGAPGDADSDLLVDSVPGLLDALYRQLQTCALLPHALFRQAADGDDDVASTLRARRRLLLHTVAGTDDGGGAAGQRELRAARGLLLLNVLRNLSMVAENEKPIADHEELCIFLILLLRAAVDQQQPQQQHAPPLPGHDAAVEIGDHALDILCNVAARVDFVALHPPARLELWHPHYQLAAHVWKKERVLPLECLLQTLAHLLLRQPPLKRAVLLRACELLCSAGRDVAVRHALATSAALRDPRLLDRVVGLLACSKGPAAAALGGIAVYDDQAMDAADDDDDDDDDDDPDDHDENSKWPAPWENDGHPSGVGMGVVYVSPEGNRSVGAHGDADAQIDHEVRDAALEVLFRLADAGDDAKLRIAKHPHCLFRVASVLTSCIGRPEAARIAVAILCSVSMNPATFPYFLPIERDLVLVACSDRSVSDILNNVVADVYGMHSL